MNKALPGKYKQKKLPGMQSRRLEYVKGNVIYTQFSLGTRLFGYF